MFGIEHKNEFFEGMHIRNNWKTSLLNSCIFSAAYFGNCTKTMKHLSMVANASAKSAALIKLHFVLTQHLWITCFVVWH